VKRRRRLRFAAILGFRPLEVAGGTTGKPKGSLAPDEEREADARRRRSAGRPDSPERSDREKLQPVNAGDPPLAAREADAQHRYDVWLAELPPQIRKAYESGSWDEVPVKWRELLRAWTLEMAKETEPDKR